MGNIFYFDAAATTRPFGGVLEKAARYMRVCWGNPSSLYGMGCEAREGIENARSEIAHAINAEIGDVYFTPTASMANSLLLKTLCQQRWTREWGCHVITTAIEHPSILNTCRFLEQNGVDVTYLRVDSNGFVNPDDLRNSIKSNTVLVSVIAASNEIGTIQPIKEISTVAHNFGIPVHIDATQMFCKVPIDVAALDIDFMTASAHKVHGLRGAALLYYRSGGIADGPNPLVNGGHQESGMIAGTENTAAIVGFGEAVKISKSKMAEDIEYVSKLREYLFGELLEIPGSHINGINVLNADGGLERKRLFNNINIRFDGVDGQHLQQMLAEKGICVSTGSACNSGSKEGSKVLRAIGLSEEDALSSVRITLDVFNSMAQCDTLVTWMINYVASLRKM